MADVDLKFSILGKPSTPLYADAFLSFKVRDGTIQYGNWIDGTETMEDAEQRVKEAVWAVLRPHVQDAFDEWKERCV